MSVSPRYPTALTPPFPTRRSSVLVLAHIIAANPAHAAQDADVVITCVGNDDDLADVVLGPNGVFRMLKKGGVFIDHTTVSARIARQISVEARDLQVHCIDAPMTGSQIGAANGTLTLLCGEIGRAPVGAREGQ